MSTDLGVTFGGVHAVDDVSFTPSRGHRRAHRRQRVGQDDDARHGVGSGDAPAGTVATRRDDLAEYLPEERQRIGIVRSFQDCRLYPELSVLDVLLLCEDVKQEVAVLSTTLQLPWARRSEQAQAGRSRPR